MPNQLRVSVFPIPSKAIAMLIAGAAASADLSGELRPSIFQNDHWLLSLGQGTDARVSVEQLTWMLARMSHLIPNMCGRLAVGDQLAREKVAEVVKPCSRQFSYSLTIGRQTSRFHNLSGSMKTPWQFPGKMNPESALPTLRSASRRITLSVAEMPRKDLRDFGGPRDHSHLRIPSRERRFEMAC